MRKPYAILLVGAVTLAGLLAGIFLWRSSQPIASQGPLLIPQPRIMTTRMPGTTSTGWSTAVTPRLAVQEALTRAKAKLSIPNLRYAFVIYSTGYSSSEVLEELKAQLPPEVRIHGLSSSIGVITNEGLHIGKSGSLAVLLVSDPGITFGVGSLDMSGREDFKEIGREAILSAIKDAGKEPAQTPQMIFFSGAFREGYENEILDGIADVVGKNTPVFGGNGGDETFQGKWSQLSRGSVYTNGLILTAIYTDHKIGWGFESDFKLLDKKGIVTKASKNIIYEIDGRPALDVYDEWRGGVYDKILAGDRAAIIRYTAQYPLARTIKSPAGEVSYCGLHPIPDANNIKDKSLPLGTAINEGDELRIFAGTWQVVLNRAERIPLKALNHGQILPQDGLFGVLTVCSGLALSLPPEELAKIPLLTDNVVQGTPFIGAITLGEEGMLPGIGNINANMVESMVIIGKSKKKD